MKIKRLICIFAAVLGMISCSNEIPEKNEGNMPLSIVLSVGKPETKAVGDEIRPSIEEVTINRYHVAIFQDGRRIAHVEYRNEISLLPEDVNDPYNPKYKAEFENIPEGNIAVYVVANYPLDNEFNDFDNEAKWGTYSLYQSQIVSTTSFEADKLIKIGYKDVKVEKNTTQIELSLVQLAAGIDVSIEQLGDVDYKEENPDKFDFLDATEENVYPITTEKEIEQYIGKQIVQNTIRNYLTFKNEEFAWVSTLVNNEGGWNNKGKEWFNVNKDKVYDRINPENGSLYFRAELKENGDYNNFKSDFKIVSFARDVECDVRVPATGLVKGNVTVENINGKSDITIFNDKSSENTQYNPIKQLSLNTRFYTYEIAEGKSDMKLKVEVGNGTVYNIYRKKYRQYGYKIYRGQWVKEGNDNHAKYDWNGGADKGFPVSIWLPVTKDSQLIDEGSGLPIRTEKGDSDLKDVKTYSLSIPGEMIIKGHLYQVKGTYSPSFDARLTWRVIDYNKKEVEIPSFN